MRTHLALLVSAAAIVLVSACRSSHLSGAAPLPLSPSEPSVEGTYDLDSAVLGSTLPEKLGAAISGMRMSVSIRGDGTYTWSMHTPFRVDGDLKPDDMSEEGTWTRQSDRVTFRPLRGIRNGASYDATDRPVSTGVLTRPGQLQYYTNQEEPSGYSVPLRRRKAVN